MLSRRPEPRDLRLFMRSSFLRGVRVMGRKRAYKRMSPERAARLKKVRKEFEQTVRKMSQQEVERYFRLTHGLVHDVLEKELERRKYGYP